MDLTRIVLPGMLERERGHVVNMASLAGKVPPAYLASYAATKHGVVGFTHALRAEHGRRAGRLLGDLPRSSSAGWACTGGSSTRCPRPHLGPLPPERVGDAVVRAIRKNLAEVIVGRPARSGRWSVLNALAPRSWRPGLALATARVR